MTVFSLPTSLMVAAPAGLRSGNAGQKRLPSLRVGLHIVLVEGRPILPPSQIPDLVDSNGLFRTDMAVNGVRMFFSCPKSAARSNMRSKPSSKPSAPTGLSLDHVNAHKHFHLHPTIASAILRIGKKFGMRALRVPREPRGVLAQIETQSSDPVAAITTPWSAFLARRLRASGVTAPDQVFGLRWSGAMTKERVRALIDRLPEGLTEIYLPHPQPAPIPVRARLSLCRGAGRPDRPRCGGRCQKSADSAGRVHRCALTYRTASGMGYIMGSPKRFAAAVRSPILPPTPHIEKSTNNLLWSVWHGILQVAV